LVSGLIRVPRPSESGASSMTVGDDRPCDEDQLGSTTAYSH
jgi:hypothetical protein